MATHDTGGQSRASRQREDEDVEQASEQDAPAADVSERHEKLTEDVDALLDAIDEVLESNSEEFVRGFVQKGGQ